MELNDATNKKYLKLYSYYGGKTWFVKKFMHLIPYHKVYIEPFFGSGVVFLNKPVSDYEVINDKDMLISTTLFVLKSGEGNDNFDKLEDMIKSSFKSEFIYKISKVVLKNPDQFEDYEVAWATIINHNTSFSGIRFGGYSYTLDVFKERLNNIDIDALSKRLKKVEIFNRDAINVMSKFKDNKDCFIFLDPPYVGNEEDDINQGHYSGYTKKDLNDLLNFLNRDNFKGKFCFTHYWNEDIKKWVNDNNLEVIEYDTYAYAQRYSNKGNSKKDKRTEIIVMNYDYKKEKPMIFNESSLF